MAQRPDRSAATAFVIGLGCVLASGPTSPAVARSVTVPIQILGNFPVVTAKIDGKDVPLMFDLGGGDHLALSRSVLDQVRTTPLEETYRFSDAKGNIIEAPTFQVSRIEIGEAVFTDIKGHVDASHPSYKATDVGQQGVIGEPFLRAYKVVLDYQNLKMTLILPDSQNAEGDGCSGTAVPFLPEWDGAPVTKVGTDFGDLTMVWDTGAPLSVIRKARADEARAKVENKFVTTTRFALGDVDFGPLPLRVFDYAEPAGTDGVVGHSFFAKHVVCIDFPGKRFLIHR